MTPQSPDDTAQFHCPDCNHPLSFDNKFCEICGAKIEPPPVCQICGAILQKDAKFCEICGTPTGSTIITRKSETIPASPERVATKPPKPAVSPVPEFPERVATKPPKPAVSPAPEFPERVATKPPKPAVSPVPEFPERVATKPPKPAASPAPVVPERKVPPSKNRVIIVGVVVVAILAAAIFFVVLPMLSSPSTTKTDSSSNPVALVTTQKPSPTASPVPATLTIDSNSSPVLIVDTEKAGSTSSPVSASMITQTSNLLVPGPTQAIPNNQVLLFQVDKDSISGEVNVIVTGPSRNVVDDIEVRLTRSDGQVDISHIKPSQKIDEIAIPGTKGTDRVEITVRFYSGETYKVIDKLLYFRSHSN